MDNEKQKYLRSGSGSDDTESLMNGFSNYFSGDMKKFLDTQDTEESQDW